MKNPLHLPVTAISGIGETKSKAFSRLGIFTLKDLIYHTPRAYENRGDVKRLNEGLDGETHAFVLTVASMPKSVTLKGRISITKFKAFDDSGAVEIVFFNQNYVKDVFSVGAEFRFWGKLTQSKGKYQITSPEYESVMPNKALPEFISRYPLVSGLTNKLISKSVQDALNMCEGSLQEHLPEEIRRKNKLPSLAYALRSLHFPQDDLSIQNALRRMSYDELFCFAIAINMARTKHDDSCGVNCPDSDISPLLSQLPYTLTSAQKRVIEEISHDMKCNEHSPAPMSRILIGDVGSGKTVCAAAAAYIAVKNGYQCAILAPTEVLANQHFADLKPIFDNLEVKSALLTGAATQKEKRDIYSRVSETGTEKIDVLIGTHALLNEKVNFSSLGLIIADEQHRFGANQRSLLKERNKSAHMLVMSATPIPRSLALTIYGDLSVSMIDEMPKGRSRVDTFTVDESYRARLNNFIHKLVSDGGQVYIVCPAIEEDEQDGENTTSIEEILSKTTAEPKPKLKNVVEHTQALKDIFPHLRIEYLHGKMKPQQKDAIMKRFSAHEIDVLVSSTVIEVGINVPNACLMVIENAERFGLSQLHQLRGRVGRGQRKSYCILVSDSKGAIAKERLNTMKNSYNGYEIAEKDLLLRGPGDFFSSNSGTAIRQSGGLSLKYSSLYSNVELLHSAFADAKDILAGDPTLSSPENKELLNKVDEIFILNENTLN